MSKGMSGGPATLIPARAIIAVIPSARGKEVLSSTADLCGLADTYNVFDDPTKYNYTKLTRGGKTLFSVVADDLYPFNQQFDDCLKERFKTIRKKAKEDGDVSTMGLNVYTNALYKFIEIATQFPTLGSKFFHFAEMPGSFILAANQTQPNYEFVAQSLKTGLSDMFGWHKDDNYWKRWDFGPDSSGDLTKPEIVEYYCHKYGGKFDTATSDLGMAKVTYEKEEQEHLLPFASQLVAMLSVIKIGGNIVMKMYNTFTDDSLNLITAVANAFEKTYMFKPMSSRARNNERYLIGLSLLNEDSRSDAIDIVAEAAARLRDVSVAAMDTLALCSKRAVATAGQLDAIVGFVAEHYHNKKEVMDAVNQVVEIVGHRVVPSKDQFMSVVDNWSAVVGIDEIAKRQKMNI